MILNPYPPEWLNCTVSDAYPRVGLAEMVPRERFAGGSVTSVVLTGKVYPSPLSMAPISYPKLALLGIEMVWVRVNSPPRGFAVPVFRAICDHEPPERP
jgi:hypothetical protein